MLCLIAGPCKPESDLDAVSYLAGPVNQCLILSYLAGPCKPEPDLDAVLI